MVDRWQIVLQPYPAPGGSLWPKSSEVLAVHAALLPSGKVVYFSGSQHQEGSSPPFDGTRLWDPAKWGATDAVKRVPSPDTDLFCCGHCLLASGDVLVAGGTKTYEAGAPARHHDEHHFTGTSSTHVFRWQTESWELGGSMQDGRWYPTCITLQDGQVFVISGHSAGGDPHENTVFELFDPVSRQWSPPRETIPPLDDTGHFTVLWDHLYVMVYYPRLHLLPDGRIFSATALQVPRTVTGPPSITLYERKTRSVNPRTGDLVDLSDPPPGHKISIMEHAYARSAFPSVLLPLHPPAYGAKILICGENQPRIFDTGNPAAGWQEAGAARPYLMRAYANATILPDATVLVVGGAQTERGAFFPSSLPPDHPGGIDADRVPWAERYLPTTNTWEQLSEPAYDPIARVYHSVALLLPDGRVWIAGSNHDGARNNEDGLNADDPSKGDARELRMEVYSPPYLFNGDGTEATRPGVEWVRRGCSYGERFEIALTVAPNIISTVALIRCSTATHAFNPDQRYVELVIRQRMANKVLVVSGPPSAVVAPPGYYLLFVIDGAGTPSVGRFFRVSDTYPVIRGNEHSSDSPVQRTYDFGYVAFGESHKADRWMSSYFSFENSGSGDLELDHAHVEGDFRDPTSPGSDPSNVTVELLPGTARPGFDAAVTVIFTPRRYGRHSGKLIVHTNAPDASFVPISLTATVVGVDLDFAPQMAQGAGLDFGDVELGREKTLAITVHNVGGSDASIVGMIVEDASSTQQFRASLPTGDPVLRIGEARLYDIEYRPTLLGQALGRVTLVAEGAPRVGPFRKEYSIALEGRATGPVVKLTPLSLTFGDQAIRTTSAPQTVTLNNIGSAPLAITRIFTVADVGGEFKQTNPCGSELAVGDTCAIAVTFSPGLAGARTGMLSIESNAMGSPHSVALSGVGVATPLAVLLPKSLDFGNQPVGTTAASRTVTLSNAGVTDLLVGDVKIAGANAGAFRISVDRCIRTAVPPDGSCPASLQFLPTRVGNARGSLEFHSNAPGSPHTVALTGVGTTPGSRTVNPTSLDFGGQALGALGPVRTVTFTNNSAAPLTITDVRARGAHAGDFPVRRAGCPGAVVLPGSSCTVSLHFAPSAVGLRTAELALTDSGASAPTVIPLSGIGIGAVVSLDPTSLVFPDQPIGSLSDRQEVTLRNEGNAPLDNIGIVVVGDFVHDTFCGAALAPGAYCLVRIRCTPSAEGVRNGEITISHDAAGSPHRVTLRGTGTPPR